jgi:hypothetical protein
LAPPVSTDQVMVWFWLVLWVRVMVKVWLLLSAVLAVAPVMAKAESSLVMVAAALMSMASSMPDRLPSWTVKVSLASGWCRRPR